MPTYLLSEAFRHQDFRPKLYSRGDTDFFEYERPGKVCRVISKIKMNKKAIIYARVSSSGPQEGRQNTERQKKALTEFATASGYEVEQIFEEHISGAKKNSERTGLQDALRYAKEHGIDIILFNELSRAGRQIWEVLETVKFCVDNHIDMYFQKEGLRLFDGDKVNGIMAIYISCLGFCAEKERENITFRLNQGRALAIERGVKMGRREGSVKTLDQLSQEYASVIKSLKRGQSIRNTAKICGVSVSTVQRVKKAFCL